MSDRNKTKTAFPTNVTNGGETGMTLRDYFAAKAFPVMMNAGYEFDDLTITGHYEELARAAYQVADAMMEARSK